MTLTPTQQEKITALKNAMDEHFVNESDIATSFNDNPSDEKVASEKLVKESIDSVLYNTETEINTALENKINKSQTVGLVKNDGSIMTSGTKSNNWTVGNDSRLSDKRKPIMTVITPNSSTDIDTYYTETGFYAFFNNSAVASMSTENKAKLPTGLETKSFYLVVENRGNYAKQTLTRYDNNKTWIRTRNADRTTPWSDWSELSVDGHTHTKSQITDFPTIPSKTSDLQNDSGFLTSHQDISGKEDKSNKVTSLSESSTNTQYPSAKCVYDELETKINIIEAINYGRKNDEEW